MFFEWTLFAVKDCTFYASATIINIDNYEWLNYVILPPTRPLIPNTDFGISRAITISGIMNSLGSDAYQFMHTF